MVKNHLIKKIKMMIPTGKKRDNKKPKLPCKEEKKEDTKDMPVKLLKKS
jgi:hypothetical protein